MFLDQTGIKYARKYLFERNRYRKHVAYTKQGEAGERGAFVRASVQCSETDRHVNTGPPLFLNNIVTDNRIAVFQY